MWITEMLTTSVGLPPPRSCGESVPRWPIAGTSFSLARQPVGVTTE